MEKNNSGFSLVELIASLAVLAVASTAIMAFMSVALKNYTRGNEEATVQYEAQIATNQITNMLIEAKKGVSYAVGSETAYTLSDGGTTSDEKYLFIYNTDGYIRLRWNGAADEKKIYYTEYDSTGVAAAPGEVLLAEYVENMSVDLTNLANNHKVRIILDFKNDKEYNVSQYVTLRNAISQSDFKINEARDVVYAPTTP